MAALVSGILWLHFCKVWGSGDSSSIFIYDIIKPDPACSKDELWILREHVFVLKQTWPPTSCLYMLRVWWNPGGAAWRLRRRKWTSQIWSMLKSNVCENNWQCILIAGRLAALDDSGVSDVFLLAGRLLLLDGPRHDAPPSLLSWQHLLSRSC